MKAPLKRSWVWYVAVACVAGIIVTARAEPVTLTIVPIGGNTTVGGQTVTVEVFFTANVNIGVQTGVLNFPCMAVAEPGSTGSATATSGTADPDGDGMSGPSSGGIPFLFGPSGLAPYQSSTCQLANTRGIGQPPTQLTAGTTRYVGTASYQFSACAEGQFTIALEHVNENNLYPENTRYRDDFGFPGGGQYILLEAIPVTITVLPLLYGDIFPAGGNGYVDVDDILCAVLAFETSGKECPQADIGTDGGFCGPDGNYNVEEILAVLTAFDGSSPCPGPCD